VVLKSGSLTFTCGDAVGDTVFTVSNSGGGTLSWSVDPPAEPNVSVSPTSGTTVPMDVTVTNSGAASGFSVIFKNNDDTPAEDIPFNFTCIAPTPTS